MVQHLRRGKARICCWNFRREVPSHSPVRSYKHLQPRWPLCRHRGIWVLPQPLFQKRGNLPVPWLPAQWWFFGRASPTSLTRFFTATILNLPIRCFLRKSCRQQGRVLTNRNGLTTARPRPSASRPIQRPDIIAYFPTRRIECKRTKLDPTAATF